MNNLLTASEAFAALQMGKTILCRPEGDMLDFADLDQFPASIFGKQGYEYCIKVELIKVAGIEFTKPLTLDDVRLDQDIYLVEPTGSIYWYKFNEVPALKTAITNGFAQADIENARLQLKAFCAAVGRDVDTSESRVVPIGDADKQKTNKKKSSKPTSQKQTEITKPVDLPENIASSLDSAIVITEQPYVSSSEDFFSQPTPEQEKNNEYQQTLDTLLQRVKESTTPAEVNAVYRYTRTWDDEQMKPILLATHKRLEELEKEKASANEPPSLMVQIQTAPDLTALDALEIDVAARDPLIQPKLMG